MGGLGNGRRGVRSPPLMIGALIACILVLGFNYWVSSSRNLELQTKLYELEGQVRRGAAERGAAEQKKTQFQEEIQRQKDQIGHIESLYKRQLEGAQNTCSQEKHTLLQNISSSTKSIQELKDQLNLVNNDLGKLQKELQSCRSNIQTLNNKLTYDMTHCNSQVLSQKELCDERIAAAKTEVQKRMEKLIASQGVTSQETTLNGAVKVEQPAIPGTTVVNKSTVVTHTAHPPELMTNDIIVDKDVAVDLSTDKSLSKVESQSIPSSAAVKQDILVAPEGAVTPEDGETATSKLLKTNLTEDKKTDLMDAEEEGGPTEEVDPGMEGMLMGPGKALETTTGQKMDEQEEYDAEGQVIGGATGEKQRKAKQEENIDIEEELADYNGDDENEGEFEADKQAELAQV